MWQHQGRLPHVLAPARYSDPAYHAREVDMLFAAGWHAVATRGSLAAAGAFVTTELLGQPLLVRNCGGDLRAFQNVCAHRHSLLSVEPRGMAQRIRCRYHGWEYDEDGKTCGVPDAPSFVPIRRGGEQLQRFRCAALGQLVFVSLAERGPELREVLGDETCAVIEAACGDAFAEVATWTIEHAANWKVPVENALESYHVPAVHGGTFRTLSHARDAHHVLAPRFTSLVNTRPTIHPAMRWLAAQWRREPSGVYGHHHAFPNLMIAHTDLSTLAQVVLPQSPTTSRSLAFCFAHRGERGTLLQRALNPLLGRMVRGYTRSVLDEDDAIFAGVQRGLAASRHAGALGAREERVHAFQEYVARAVPS
jgi:phenylpropionate dioxygenase-like ring-hydroxylating dioxygenase large terminal subunit